MNDCNAECCYAGIKDCRCEYGIHNTECSQPDSGTEDIDGQMHDGNALCVGAGTDRGDNCGDTGTDILTHDDRNGGAGRNECGERQRLQNTDGSGRGLNHRRDNRTEEQTQQRIFKLDKNIGKGGGFGERLNCIGHHFHTENQNGKADENGTDGVFAVTFGHHAQNDADEGKNRCEVDRLHHSDKECVAFNAGKTKDPGGDCGTDIGTEGDFNGLCKLHDAGVDKTDKHDSGCGGRLNCHCDGSTEKQPADGT